MVVIMSVLIIIKLGDSSEDIHPRSIYPIKTIVGPEC